MGIAPERRQPFQSHAGERDRLGVRSSITGARGIDVDLLVEMESERRPPELEIEVSSIFGLRKWPLDAVVYTPSEVERLRSVRGTLMSIIEAEGEVHYERS
jgi:hypothetical protein